MNLSQDHLGEDAVTELPEHGGITMDVLPTLNLVKKKYMLTLKGKVIPEYKSREMSNLIQEILVKVKLQNRKNSANRHRNSKNG